jgi:hypothetical protein
VTSPFQCTIIFAQIVMVFHLTLTIYPCSRSIKSLFKKIPLDFIEFSFSSNWKISSWLLISPSSCLWNITFPPALVSSFRKVTAPWDSRWEQVAKLLEEDMVKSAQYYTWEKLWVSWTILQGIRCSWQRLEILGRKQGKDKAKSLLYLFAKLR